jgi:hypothetical protein
VPVAFQYSDLTAALTVLVPAQMEAKIPEVMAMKEPVVFQN